MIEFIHSIGGWWEFVKGIGEIIIIAWMIPILFWLWRDHCEQQENGHSRD